VASCADSSSILRWARQAMREYSSPALARGYLALIRDELEKIEEKRRTIEPAHLLPIHRAMVASLHRAQLGYRLLEVSDCVMVLDRHLSASACDAAGPWLEDAALLVRRMNGEDARREQVFGRLLRSLDPLDVKWSAPKGGPIESVPDSAPE
jgi:hypothetical protein